MSYLMTEPYMYQDSLQCAILGLFNSNFTCYGKIYPAAVHTYVLLFPIRN